MPYSNTAQSHSIWISGMVIKQNWKKNKFSWSHVLQINFFLLYTMEIEEICYLYLLGNPKCAYHVEQWEKLKIYATWKMFSAILITVLWIMSTTDHYRLIVVLPIEENDSPDVEVHHPNWPSTITTKSVIWIVNVEVGQFYFNYKG